MEIHYDKNFKKHFNSRIKPYSALQKKFLSRLELFLKDNKDPSLKDHQLHGKKSELRSFSITGDVRLVYKIIGNELWLCDIGSHNQVY